MEDFYRNLDQGKLNFEWFDNMLATKPRKDILAANVLTMIVEPLDEKGSSIANTSGLDTWHYQFRREKVDEGKRDKLPRRLKVGLVIAVSERGGAFAK